ncbi:MAG: TolC family protein [Gammaproteobacteria bacterium]|nr:TolC family protein [Gammaproteobacteria bacterium]
MPTADRKILRQSGVIAAAGLVTALVACAPRGPDYVRPDVPLNPDWLDLELEHYEIDTADLTQWWHTLEDPVLDRLIATAYEQNNTKKIAGLRVLESQARLGIAFGSQYPQFQVATGDATAIDISKSSANSDTRDLSFLQYNLAATLSWEMDFWGRFRRSIEAADAGLLVSIADYDDVLVLLTAQVADIYTIIRATEEQLQLARESLDIQQRSYDIVQLLFENGATSELDALQARTLLLSTEAVIPSLEATLRQSKYALSALLGMVPADIEGLLGGEGTLPSVPAQVAIGIPANLLRQRPDVRRAELQALAQNALVGVAEASLYPSFSLNGTLGLSATDNTTTSSSGNNGIGELFSSDSLTYAVGASFVWPFFNYGRIRNNIRVEDARLQQALIAYRETVIRAMQETENALTSFSSTRLQDVILREGVATARRSADLSLLRYQEGFADYQRVLDAQQSLFGQQQRYAANRGDIVRSLIAIYRSLGGGWQANRQYIDEQTRQQLEGRTNWGELLDNPPQ